MKHRMLAVLCATLVALIPSTLSAAPILSPVSASATSEFSASFDIGNTIDQSGLSSGFVSGVTDFDAYLATNPVHSYVAANLEWFTATGVTSAMVTYDLGAIYAVKQLALWNEEASGMANFSIGASADGLTYTTVLSGVTPNNNPPVSNYPAQVFNLGIASAQYIQFNITQCPQQPAGFNGCGIGEVAFAVSAATTNPNVPEPASLSLLALGLVGVGLGRCRARRSR